MNICIQQILILPIIVPFAAGAVTVLLSESQHSLKATICQTSVLAQLTISLVLLYLTEVDNNIWPWGIGVYFTGEWDTPFGIVLVIDRLAAIMLALTATIALVSLIYAQVNWNRAGVHFHALFQFLLMGLNGAFSTGDLFNLFVFFEVLLAASYGLLLHGSGVARVTAGLHYITINLFNSALLLVSIALIYGITGTLNLADLAIRTSALVGADRLLFESALAILGLAFLVKAGAWPLNFWLIRGYTAACAPVASIFCIMTKVGIYGILRISSLLEPVNLTSTFSPEGMFTIGLITLIFGSLGAFLTQKLEKLAGHFIIVSSGILLMALGAHNTSLVGPAIFYLLNSVLSASAFFLLIEMIQHHHITNKEPLTADTNIFDPDNSHAPNSEIIVGIPIPTAIAFLGLAFVICVLLITGLPPFSSFFAKFSLLSATIEITMYEPFSLKPWLLVIAVLSSGLSSLLVLIRLGIHIFWSTEECIAPQLHSTEIIPVAVVIFLCMITTITSDSVFSYLDLAAKFLGKPYTYIEAVMSS